MLTESQLDMGCCRAFGIETFDSAVEMDVSMVVWRRIGLIGPIL